MSFSHHGEKRDHSPILKELMERFEQQVEGRAKRAYSEGRIKADDEGDLAAAIITDRVHKKIIMDFGKPVTWLAMSADDAVKWGSELIRRAREISDKPITIDV